MPSEHVLQVQAKGLITAPNPLLVPRDALRVADNVILERPGLIQSRRGLKRFTNALGGPIWGIATFGGYTLANFGTLSPAAASGLRINNGTDGGGTWTSISTDFVNNVEDGKRMHSAEALGSLYVTQAKGPMAFSPPSSLEFVGLPKALGLDRYGPAAVLTGTGGFLTDGNCVAYRAVLGLGSGAGIRLGAPSSRTIIANASGTSGYSATVARNVVARVLLPKKYNTTTALTTSYFLQLYRSGQVANGQTPSDEMQLVFEAYLTAQNITDGYVDVTDLQPDSLRGAYLYTNPNTGEDGVRIGVLNANTPPPPSVDLAFWRDSMWYAGAAYGQPRFAFQLLGTASSGATGLQAGDTITITKTVGGTTQVYTAIASGGTPTAGQFVVETSTSAGSVSAAIEQTANNLVAAINKNASNTLVYAYYISGSAPDAPGKVLLEARLTTGSGFSVVTSAHGNSYAPSLVVAQTASEDYAENRLYFSKPGQPEAVPVVNYFEVGPSGSSIKRIVPLGNQLYVLSSSGVYRVLGTDYTNFAVDPVDLTCIVAAPETACALDGSLYFLTNQGAVEATEGTIQYISQPIDSDLRAILQALLYDPTNGTEPLATYAFAVAHQLDHRVLFWLPASTTAQQCAYAYVFDRRARAWTRWYRTATDLASAQGHSCAAYTQNGPTAIGMTLGTAASASDNWCFLEKRTLTEADYSDDSNAGSKVTIKRIVAWAYQDANDASIAKQFREVQVLYGDQRPETTTITLDTEINGMTATVTTTFAIPTPNKMVRIPVGQACGRAARLSVTLTSSADGLGFDVAGLAVTFRPYSSRLTRGP
jgi:hypothetical protein